MVPEAGSALSGQSLWTIEVRVLVVEPIQDLLGRLAVAGRRLTSSPEKPKASQSEGTPEK